MVVDYRALNIYTVKNRTTLPLIGKILNRLSAAKIYTKLNLKDAYYRIRIRAGDKWKTAFRTRYGYYEFRVIPIGLVNMPATFQLYINQALIGLIDVSCIIYLDDILVFSDNPEEYKCYILEVLECLKATDLYINYNKYEFYTT